MLQQLVTINCNDWIINFLEGSAKKDGTSYYPTKSYDFLHVNQTTPLTNCIYL